MRPILFSIGHLHFYGYGLMIALGIILAVCVAEKRAGRFGLDSSKIFGLGITAAVSGIIGAKILFVITEIPTIIQDPRAFFKTLTSEGFVVYGGIIFGILCCMFYCSRNKMDFIRYFDLTMPSVALAQGFGRLGCFLAGCCYGRATDAWYGMVFRASSYAPSDTAVIPTQLISSALNFINFLVLCLFARKAKKGQVASLYLLNYSVGRFLIEFLRDDPRGNVGTLSTSQFISLFIFAIGLVLMIISSHRKEETANSEQ